MRDALLAMIVLGVVATSNAQPYSTSPDWASSDDPVSTGAALVDLDLDGWLDLVVANGNDIYRERLAVYYNQGDGTYPATPDWQSADIGYHGHLSVADVNGDGWQDVAVAGLGTGSFLEPAAKLYLNNGGTLSSNPDWTSHVNENAFGVAFGDVNNDGRPDLAVATGWPYSNPDTFHNYVYLNTGGALELTPSWQSADMDDYMTCLWVDSDRDGWLDLLMFGGNHPTRLYRNNAGTLSPHASWATTDADSQYCIMGTIGDVTGDGLHDLITTDNTQLFGGSGRVRMYPGQPGGDFATAPTWSYYHPSFAYGSAVALADVDADGDLDLAAGAWWSTARLFRNGGSGFPSYAFWYCSTSSVVERIVFGDVDRNGSRTVSETFAPAAGQRLLWLPHQPVEEITAVLADGAPLSPAQYTANTEHGWVTVGVDAAEVTVTYVVSSRLDMAITNWDGTIGNWVFYNGLVTPGDANCDGVLDVFDINPFVALLLDPADYASQYPGCDGATFCDMNTDGAVDVFDINPFVDALLN